MITNKHALPHIMIITYKDYNLVQYVPYSLVERNPCFGETCCFLHQGRIIYSHHNPQDHGLHNPQQKNHKPHMK